MMDNNHSKAGSAPGGNLSTLLRLVLCQMIMQPLGPLPFLTLLLFSVLIQPQ